MGAIGDQRFDLIFDDGSHRPDDQQVSLSYFFKLLKPGGLYFIEDLMANGMGDQGAGRCYCGDVINTRKLLKTFSTNGSFVDPHALQDPDHLAREIDSICFHVPKIALSTKYRMKLRRPVRASMAYLPDSETLCMIKKRVGAN